MNNSYRRIAIFRVGYIGDTIIALPALWTVRKAFPNAEILYITQRIAGTTNIQGVDILRKGTVYDRAFEYKFSSGVTKMDMIRAALSLRKERIDAVIYMPPERTLAQLKRDALFFKIAGVKKVIGMKGYEDAVFKPQGVPLPTVTNTCDFLIENLRSEGVSVPDDPFTLMHMGLSQEERDKAKQWLEERGVKPGDLIIGIGPGSKMPSKLWSAERFHEVAKAIDEKYSPIFLAFGSPGERDVCEKVVAGLGRAINCAGEIDVRMSSAIFEHVSVYVGNDTGTMHIAVSGGAKCVALFSARDWPGRWNPYGEGHVVFREFVPCEGCMLEVCDKDNLCLQMIQPDRVTAAALRLIELTERRAMQ